MDSLKGALPASLRSLLRHTALAYLERRERRRRTPRRIICLLAHMRSGSTLLMHLLSSHPKILSAGERNATYAHVDDLDRLAVEIAYARRQLLRDPPIVADQINHSRFLPDPTLLDDPRVIRIFLVREPRAAIASMVEVLGRHYGMTLQEAVDYYLERLPALAQTADALRGRQRSFFLTYGDLVAQPGPMLRQLSDFLAIEPPLSERYRTFRFTGGSGDPSRRIRSGRVRDDLPSRHVDLDATTLEQLQSTYQQAITDLTRSCVNIEVAA